MLHTPVLAETAINWLVTSGDGRYLDGTVGDGGHLVCLLQRLGPAARVLGIDRDPHAIKAAGERTDDDGRLRLRSGLFGELLHHARQEDLLLLDGILLDLGVSSSQLDDPARGFTYMVDAPLDMRMNPGSGKTAADLLGECSAEELERIFRDGGEVRHARRFAQAVIDIRRSGAVERSSELRELVEELTPPDRQIKVLSQLFQALRIEVNDELSQLETALKASVDGLRVGGRLVMIAYHSLEDRMVKHFFRDESRECICPSDFPVCSCDVVPRLRVLTGRAVKASQQEISVNPRARSARMRVAERVAPLNVEGERG